MVKRFFIRAVENIDGEAARTKAKILPELSASARYYFVNSPYIKNLITPWKQKIKAAGALGWDYVLDAGPTFSDEDPMSGNAYNEDYIFLFRATFKDSASAVYTFKIKPSNGKLFELDKASNMWIQRKSNPALMPVLVSLCK